MHPVVLASRVLAAAPGYTQTQPPGTQGLTTILSWGAWLVAFLCVAGILVVAGTMAVAHHRGGDGAQSASRLGWVLGACVLGASASALAGALI